MLGLFIPVLALMQTPGGQLGFDPPPGYVAQRNGEVVVLAPSTPADRTPCIYGVAPDRPASGNLEADAEAALLQSVVPGWRRLDEGHYAMRGTSAAGWPYLWYRAAFQGDINGQSQAVNAMAMVLPAGRERVHVVWGMGSIARCLLDDVAFEQLFHSLQPAGWSSDSGHALLQAIARHLALHGERGITTAHVQGRRPLRARSGKQSPGRRVGTNVLHRDRGPVHAARRRAHPDAGSSPAIGRELSRAGLRRVLAGRLEARHGAARHGRESACRHSILSLRPEPLDASTGAIARRAPRAR